MTDLDAKRKDFERFLAYGINYRSLESVSDTPDFVLASFLSGVLSEFDAAVNQRTKYFAPQPCDVEPARRDTETTAPCDTASSSYIGDSVETPEAREKRDGEYRRLRALELAVGMFAQSPTLDVLRMAQDLESYVANGYTETKIVQGFPMPGSGGNRQR